MPDIRKRTVYRRRLSSAAQTPKSLVCWRGSLCPILRCNRWSRKPLRLASVETSTPAAVAATGSSGCSIPTAKTTLFKSRASSKAEACFRTFHLHAAKGWKRVQLPNGTIPRLRQLCFHRCHLSVQWKAGLAEQSFRRREWRHLRYSRQADTRHTATPGQRWRRLLDYAGVETRDRRHLGQ